MVKVNYQKNIAKEYKHRQMTYLPVIILAILFGMYLMSVLGFSRTESLFRTLIIPGLFLSLVTLNFSFIKIDEIYLEITSGPRMIAFGPFLKFKCKKFLLQDIESWRIVRNPWYYSRGGINLSSKLYGVPSPFSLEIKMKTGENHRIMTNAPNEFEKNLREIIKKRQT